MSATAEQSAGATARSQRLAVGRPWAKAAVDATCLVVALAAGIVGFTPLFGNDDSLIAGLGGIVLGTAIALTGAWRRFSAWGVVLCTLAAYLVFGGALADGATAFAGMVPTLQTLRDLVVGIVASWKALVTAHAPVGVYANMGIAPLLLGLVCSVIAVSVGVRAPRPAWALLPVGVLFVAVIVLGADVAASPVAQGVVATGCSVGWIAWRRLDARSGQNAILGSDAATARRARLRTVAGAAALAVIAGAVAVAGGAAAVPPGSRDVLRDAIQPPVDVHDLPSPLASYRKYVSGGSSTVLFTVKGLPNGARIRLATMDAYDGIVYSVAAQGGVGSGTFSPVGTTIPPTSGESKGTSATLTFSIRDLTGEWLPDAGYLRSVSFAGSGALSRSLAYNSDTGTAILQQGLSSGLTYTVKTTIPPDYSDARIGQAAPSDTALPALSNVPDVVSQLAAKLVGGAKTAVQKARDLQQGLSHDGYYSDGLKGQAVSPSGHGEARISALLSAKQMIGDDEQYAVAMALMARKLGLPARVVMGFYPKSSSPSQTIEITGADLHAWTEVDFAGYGWVAFDPTPATSRKPPSAAPQPDPQPHNQVVQPPPVPKAQPTLPPEPDSQKSKQNHGTTGGSFWAVLGAVATVGGITLGVLVVLLGPPLLIAAIKLRRRRHRRQASSGVARMTGAWDELVDHAVDAGAAVWAGGTRRETATALAERLSPEVVTVAERADGGVFGPGEPTEDEVERLWSEVETIVGRAEAAATRWARLRGRVSLRSLRRRGRTLRARGDRGGAS